MKSSNMSRVRDILKSVPGLVWVIRHLRALWRNSAIAVIAHTMAWGTRTRARRLLVFAALPDQLALALHPLESYIVNAADKVIGRSLYAGGQFDFQKFETACRLIRVHAGLASDAVLIDAGANIGSICIPAVKRGLVARAIAFEPDPENFRLLKVNAALNGVDDRIEARQMAVGATEGRVLVLHSTTNFGDHRVRASVEDDDTTVPMIPLDRIADELDLSRTILWMDVQGYEGYALQGARRFIEAGVPLIAEFSREDLDSTGSFETFLSVIAASGYGIFWDLNNPQPDPAPVSITALRALSDRLERQRTFTDLLFLPDRTA